MKSLVSSMRFVQNFSSGVLLLRESHL